MNQKAATSLIATGSTPYPIGKAGIAWGNDEKKIWLAAQKHHRSYALDVESFIEKLRPTRKVIQYGCLDYEANKYPLYALKSPVWRNDLPVALVTGGVHGYETSGVHGALRFALEHFDRYAQRINILVTPCISPWSYETIQRWNPDAIDPNRSFRENSPSAECAALLNLLSSIQERVLVHIDLHETTNTDELEFRPALAARDGTPFVPDVIPDGFYVVDDADAPSPEFQSAIIKSVAEVTHIAPPDDEGKIIGSPVVAHGVIQYPLKRLGLCAGITDAIFRTTTEVYPDSPSANPEQCIRAQVTAVCAAIDYALDHSSPL